MLRAVVAVGCTAIGRAVIGRAAIVAIAAIGCTVIGGAALGRAAIALVAAVGARSLVLLGVLAGFLAGLVMSAGAACVRMAAAVFMAFAASRRSRRVGRRQR
jgi:hypothetical protein